MQFMVTWQVDQDRWIPILEKWSSMTPEQRGDTGEGVKFVGRWHDFVNRTGVLIVETNDTAALNRYLGQRHPHMDITATPVLDDEESAKSAKEILAAQG